VQSIAVTVQRKLSVMEKKQKRYVFSLDVNVSSVLYDCCNQTEAMTNVDSMYIYNSCYITT